MRGLSIGIMALVATPPSSWAAVPTDDLCGLLRTFEDAPFSQGRDGQPIRRFVEFQWSNSWEVGGTWGCRHTPDPVASNFCSYLIGHTNQEFSSDLPIRVLRCHGYVFPSYSTDWHRWVADIRLRGPNDDRSLDLDVYLISGSVDAAVRISAVPNNPGTEDKEPPPLSSTPSVADKGS